MRPIFTIHAGEYLVAKHIEENYKNVRIWMPSKDDGIDLLITTRECKKSISLQVKFSKDYFQHHVDPDMKAGIKGMGWWTFSRGKIEKSLADYWVLLTYSYHDRGHDFVIIKPKDLLKFYDNLKRGENFNTYLWAIKNKPQDTKASFCWETRGLNKKDQVLVAKNEYRDQSRNLSKYLNNWEFLSTYR